MVNPLEFTNLRRAFNQIDTNHSGTIEIEELKDVVKSHHANLSQNELKSIIKELDINGSGVIHYHEFIAAVFPVEKYATRERLESLFMKFNDTDHHEYISKATLKDAFSKLGHTMTSEEVDEVMREADINNDQ